MVRTLYRIGSDSVPNLSDTDSTMVASARIVELFDATLYMFLSNEDDVIREIRAFVLHSH